MALAAVFSEEDKEELKEKLLAFCEYSWTHQGYKKTSIKTMCDHVDISVGTFYTLFSTKEDLFYKTIMMIQNRLSDRVMDTLENNPTKEGFAQSLKVIFREYDSKPLLYDVNADDFQSFISKLPNDLLEKIQFGNTNFFSKGIEVANLQLKVEKEKAFGIFSALLSTISAKKALSTSGDYLDIFDFMVDNLMPTIFETRDDNVESN